MDSFGLAELTLIAVGVLFVAMLAVTVFTVIRHGGLPTPLARARRLGAERAFVATVTALSTFAVLILVHIGNPLFEGAPFILGPIAAAAAGLAAFLLMPTPTLDGPLRRRTAEAEPRRLSTYSTSSQRRTFAVVALFTTAVTLLSGLFSQPSFDGRFLCTSLYASSCSGSGPYLYPGWLFAAPALVLVIGLYALVRMALQRIVLAPATIWPELSDADTAMRAGAIRFVLRVAGAAFGLTAGLFLGLASLPLFNAPLLETGLSADNAAIVSRVGLVLLGMSVITLVYALGTAIVAVTGLLRTPRLAALGTPREAASS